MKSPSAGARQAVQQLDLDRQLSPEDRDRELERRKAREFRVLTEMVRKVVREELERFRKDWRR